MSGSLQGHRQLRLGVGPFAGVVPVLLLAAAWLAAAVLAGATGALPGGRWLSVHLFTLGVLTNLLVGFSQHFARSVTRVARPLGRWHLPVLNAGIVGVLSGMLTDGPILLALGSAALLAVVGAGRLRLAQLRRAAPAARFGWVVRAYERAHEAFAAGALLGALLGAGLVPGTWYASARLAHLHLNLLGWTGLTVLATVLLFAPAMLRVRVPEGAEQRAARALQGGGVGLAAGVVLLLLPQEPGSAGVLLRLGAAAGLAVYAWPVLSVTRSVARMAVKAHPGAARPLVAGAMAWFSAAILADVLAVALGTARWQIANGIAFGLGALLQLILAVGLYLLPSLRGRGFAARDALIARTERGSAVRATLLNVAVAVLVADAAPTALAWPPAVAIAAWAALLAVVASTLLLAALPVRPDPGVARSSVARRYRDASTDR